MGSYRVCMCFTRKFRLSEPEPPEDVKEAFKKYGGGDAHLTAEQLLRFLIEEQKEEGATITHAEAIVNQIIQKHHHIPKFARGHTLSLDDFYHYLSSVDLNPTFIPKVHHDMSAPLSHYYIYTGHNSYLTGNQLTSDCSEVPIIRALEKGVRVIELDIWPNSSEDDVLVLHGRTATAPVELIRCLKAIKEYAFSASPYPVVITLEDHLTSDLQAKVAQMLTETFSDALFCPESEYLKDLPSPEDLKYRFLISTKPPKEYLEAETLKDKKNDFQMEKDSDDDVWGQEPSNLTADQAEKEESNIDRCESDRGSEDDDEPDQKVRPPPAYKRLIAIHAGKPKGGLSEALKVDPDKVRRLSLSEQALEKAAESHGKDIIRFTQRNILRIYPKGTRFNSSNYKPFVGWMHGAQMVAFNMQGYGRSLWLMQGWFRANGGCGYVKKPEFLMKVGQNNEVFDPQIDRPVKMTLKVTVYMGEGWHLDFKQTHFDPYSPPDFYAKVGIAGVPADAVMKKTKKIEDTWLPIWNEQFTFSLTVPELAILRIEVHEYDMSEKDEFAGQTCIPVSELRPGIRAVALHNKKGETYKSVKVLMRFEFL